MGVMAEDGVTGVIAMVGDEREACWGQVVKGQASSPKTLNSIRQQGARANFS